MAIGRSEFLNAWKDYLPESWRDEASLSKLTVSVPSCYFSSWPDIRRYTGIVNHPLTTQDGTYKHPDPTTICFMGGAERQKAKEKLPTESGAAAKKTRNWHEFFKSQKRR